MKKSLLYSLLFVAAWCVVLQENIITSFFIQTMLMFFIIMGYLSYQVYKKTDWLLAISFFYFSISSVPRLFFVSKFHPNFNDQGILAFQAIISQGILYFILVSLCALIIYKKSYVKYVFLSFGFLNSIAIITKYIINQDPWFLFNNPAMDASFIACTLPLALHYKKWMAPTMIIAALLTKTSSSILGVSLALTLYYIQYLGLFLTSTLTTLILLFGYFTQGMSTLTNSSGRYHVWELALNFIKETDVYTLLLGSSTGTWQVYGPTLQVLEAIKNKTYYVSGFFWMHNDWLQILFENGIIGLILTLLCVGRGMIKIKSSPLLLSMSVTYMAIMILQMPLRHIIFTLLGACLLLTTTQLKNKS